MMACNRLLLNTTQGYLDTNLTSLGPAVEMTPPECPPLKVTSDDIIYYIFKYTFIGVISVVCLIGNSLVLSILLTNNPLRCPSVYFLVSLACSDFMSGLTYPLYNISHFDFEPVRRVLGPWNVCRMLVILITLPQTASAYNLVLITTARFMAVRWPLHFNKLITWRKCVAAIVGAWTLAAIISFALYYRPKPVGYCLECRYEKIFSQKILLVLLAVTFLLPLIIMITLYGNMAWLIRSHRRRIRDQVEEQTSKNGGRLGRNKISWINRNRGNDSGGNAETTLSSEPPPLSLGGSGEQECTAESSTPPEMKGPLSCSASNAEQERGITLKHSNQSAFGKIQQPDQDMKLDPKAHADQGTTPTIGAHDLTHLKSNFSSEDQDQNPANTGPSTSATMMDISKGESEKAVNTASPKKTRPNMSLLTVPVVGLAGTSQCQSASGRNPSISAILVSSMDTANASQNPPYRTKTNLMSSIRVAAEATANSSQQQSACSIRTDMCSMAVSSVSTASTSQCRSASRTKTDSCSMAISRPSGQTEKCMIMEALHARSLKHEARLVRVVIFLLGYFTLAWMPVITWVFVQMGCGNRCRINRYLMASARILLFSNSAINIFIYAGRHAGFRKAFYQKLKKLCCLFKRSNRN